MRRLSGLLEYTSLSYICGFALFFAIPIYLEWNNPTLGYIKYIYLLLLVFCYAKNRLRVSGDSLIWAILFALLFMWEKFSIGLNIVGMLFGSLFVFAFFIPITVRKQVLDCFVLKIYPVVLGVSTLFYVLWLSGIFSLPETVIDTPNEANKFAYYTTHVFFVTPASLIERFRFCSFYDEPGVVGSLCAIIIFFYNKKLPGWIFAIYLIAGVLSFSFFFFCIMIFFMISTRSYKSSQYFLWVCFIIVITLFIISKFDSGFIDTFFDRFSIENGELVGNNRNHDDFSYYFYHSFVNSSDFLFGSHDVGVDSISSGSFSIQVMIYRHGFIWVLYGLLLYGLLLWKYKATKYSFVVSIIVYFLMNYQRPCFTDAFYFIFFTTIIQSKTVESNIINRRKYESVSGRRPLPTRQGRDII